MKTRQQGPSPYVMLLGGLLLGAPIVWATGEDPCNTQNANGACSDVEEDECPILVIETAICGTVVSSPTGGDTILDLGTGVCKFKRQIKNAEGKCVDDGNGIQEHEKDCQGVSGNCSGA